MEPWILILIAIAVAVAIFLFRRQAAPALPETSVADADAKGATTAARAKLPEPKAETPGAEEPVAEAKPSDVAKAGVVADAKPIAAEAPKADATPPAKAEEKIEPKVERPSFRPSAPVKDEEAESLRKGLGATRTGFFGRLKELFSRKPDLDPASLDEVEEILLSSDVGVATTTKLLTTLRTRHGSGELPTSDALRDALRDEAKSILRGGAGAIKLDHKPTVLLFVGVNGVGKTTTIGKLASRFKEEGKKVLLAAGDTYRAAAVIQLEAWSRRVGCDVQKGKDRADPSGVIFDAIKRGVDEGYDVVLCDTAGRLQTKMPLMDELAKIGRSVEKALGRNADETLLVLDATTGQNAIQQATQFGSTLPLTGIVLTKLDGTAKGGVILGIVDEQKVPVRYVGIGERLEDLRAFDSDAFVDALFDPREDA